MMHRSHFEHSKPQVYTVEEAAALLHVSAREVNRLIRNRELAVFYLGRKRSLRRIADFSLQEFIQQRIDETKKSEKS